MLRIFTFFKYIIYGFVRILCTILRCGKRKKVEADDSLPTDIVIGDAPNTNYQNYGASTMTNGYEVMSPAYYDQSQQARHPYQSKFEPSTSAEYQQEPNPLQMDSWDQWDYQDNSRPPAEQQDQTLSPSHQKESESPTEEMNFFADMEPSVKVKKIFIKKKAKVTNTQRNRLAIDQDLDFKTSSELDAWQEEDNGEGWMDEDGVDLDNIDADEIVREARELRKQERMHKSEEQKKLKLAKKTSQHRDHRLGMKVS